MFGMPQCRAAPMPAADSDGEEAYYSCRICFEDAKPSELISPCKCKGTLKFVHQGCLHKWQANVARLGGKRDERATVCGVCRSRYTSLPPKAALHVWRKIWAATRGLVGAGLISLLALCLSGPPVLHLALLVLLLLGTRSQSLLAMLLLVLGGVAASLYARGLRLVVRGAGDGDLRFGLALIRHGAPIEGLQAGSLLVAHGSRLQGTMFAQAVVLITEKSARGAKGVMLTQPMETADSLLWAQHQPLSQAATGSSAAHSAAIRHYLGGPVGLPSRTGPASHTVVLHHIATVPGASQLITAAAAQQEQDSMHVQQLDTAAAQDQQQQQQPVWRLPAWQKMLKACSSTGRRHILQQQQVLGVAPSALSSSAAGRSAALSSLSLYQGGSMDVLLQAVLQANNAAAAAAPAAAAAGPGSGLASKLRWPLHQRGSANRHQLNRNTNNNNQQQQQQHAGSSSNSNPGQSRQQQLSQAELAALAAALRMYHGVCVWGAGQLEGEIRAGAWGVAVAELRDIVATPPQLLWEQLLGSNRARWF